MARVIGATPHVPEPTKRKRPGKRERDHRERETTAFLRGLIAFNEWAGGDRIENQLLAKVETRNSDRGVFWA